MPPFQAVILGLVQGLTEFLPVSSSGHLILFPWLFGWQTPGLAFDVALHGGTLLGVVAYYRRDLIDLSKNIGNQRLPWMIALATLPAVAAGLLFGDLIEEKLRSPLVICGTLAGVGLLMAWADRRARSNASLLESLAIRSALAIGVAQAFALIPGVSRSGITIVAGLLVGLDRSAAVRFSFLLSIPVIAGAAALKLPEVLPFLSQGFFWLGFAASAVSGFAAIHLLVTFVRTKTFMPFVIYRIALAAFIFLVFLSR